jgi:hypothetical protein
LRARESSAWFSCCEFREFVDSIQLRKRPSKLVSSLAAALWQFDGKKRRPALAGLQNSCVARPSTLRACTQDAPHVSCHLSRATYLASRIWHPVSRAMNVRLHVIPRHATSSARARHC